MSRKHAPNGAAIDAAHYQLEKGISTEEAAKLFNVAPGSINCASYQHGIPHPNPRKHKMGRAIQAAKMSAYSDLTIDESASIHETTRGAIFSAARRMGMKLRNIKQNRNLMLHKNAYYYRDWLYGFRVCWHLGKDLDYARNVRDKLESFFESNK